MDEPKQTHQHGDGDYPGIRTSRSVDEVVLRQDPGQKYLAGEETKEEGQLQPDVRLGRDAYAGAPPSAEGDELGKVPDHGASALPAGEETRTGLLAIRATCRQPTQAT